MLYEVVLAVLTCYALCTPAIMIYCIKFGYKMAEDPKKEAEKPLVPKKTKPIELTEQQKKEIRYMENIMRFDGTAKGQKKIEG